MPLTDSDYNNFSKTLTGRFAERCKGLDEGSRRVVDGRPADHVLVGFLTPVQDGQGVSTSGTANQGGANNPDDSDADQDLALTDDLPRDSAYEQTALGLEWIAPLEYMRDDIVVDVDLQLCVYVRRLPTFEEQSRQIEWNWQPSAGGSRTCNMIQAWSRETLPCMRVSFNMGKLRRERRLAESVSDQVRREWEGIDKTNLYPGRQAITILETELTSPDAYNTKLTALQSNKIPVDWNPVIDIRLISMPTEPGCVRVALRAINQTTGVKDKYRDHADPNLYAVKVKAALPQELHRMAIFQELPASFRYNREMYGIGINAHVDGRVDSPQMVLETDSVPVKLVNRLEPQKISGADPRFHDLAKNPLPILRTILDEMRGYDATNWANKIASLSSDVEHQDAEDAYDVPRNLSQCLRCTIAADPDGGNHAEAAQELHRRTQSQDRLGSGQRPTHGQ